jgi:hypothetical protein
MLLNFDPAFRVFCLRLDRGSSLHSPSFQKWRGRNLVRAASEFQNAGIGPGCALKKNCVPWIHGLNRPNLRERLIFLG